MTDETKDNFSYLSPVTPSSPVSGHNDRKAFAVTTGADCNYQSTISPIFPDIQPDDIPDSTPNWLPTWSTAELRHM